MVLQHAGAMEHMVDFAKQRACIRSITLRVHGMPSQLSGVQQAQLIAGVLLTTVVTVLVWHFRESPSWKALAMHSWLCGTSLCLQHVGVTASQELNAMEEAFQL